MKSFLIGLLFCVIAFTAPAHAQNLGGPFTLTAHNGKQVTDKDFRGKYMLVYFGFATCPDVCPLAVKKIDDVLTQLGTKSAQIVPVFITIDPERDTPEKMRQFITPISSRVIGLTGTRAQIDDVIGKYKVMAQKVPDLNHPDGYSFLHAEFIFVMSPQGTFYSLLQGGQSVEYLANSLYAIIK